MKTILCDIDGVLRDLVTKLIEVYKRELPNEISVNHADEIKQFDLKYYFSIKEDIYNFLMKTHSLEIYCNAKRYEQAKEFLRELNKNNKIILVSNQENDLCVSATNKWLKYNQLDEYTVIYEKNKGKIKGDILLDDYTKNLKNFAETRRIAVCFDRSWNKDWDGFRVHSYYEFIQFVNNLY